MAKRILISGATGFVGRALISHCLREGFEVIAWVRNAAHARSVLGEHVTLVRAGHELVDALGDADTVVHLAGSPVAARRWSASVKREIRASRVETTNILMACMREASTPPRVLVCASGVGFYGLHGPVANESETAGDDFLAQVCVAWEHAANEAETLGVRVVNARLGVVLGKGGGAFEKLRSVFSLGLGGRIGNGEQIMPWVHLDDVVDAMLFAVNNEALRGPMNVAAPEIMNNKAFTETFAKVLKRKAVCHVPGFILKAALGEAASMLLEGRAVVPEVLLKHGFVFLHPTINDALMDLVAS